MADIEKVKHGLKCHTHRKDCRTKAECPYYEDEWCSGNLANDALSVIEELQAENERLKSEVEIAREKGFEAGQNNVFDSINEGW